MIGWSTFVRQATALCLLLAIALAVTLLTVTHRVQGLEEELGGLRTGITAEEQKIHVLQAEFSFLTEPERLRRLASAHLGLAPIEPAQLVTLPTLDEVLRSHAEGASDSTQSRDPRVGSSKEHRR